MTTSTTLKLPDELKARIAPLAKAAGKTPHAWMLEALDAQAVLTEMRRSFIEDALASAAEVDAGVRVTRWRTSIAIFARGPRVKS
jgi:predicted transcriptional regulator